VVGGDALRGTEQLGSLKKRPAVFEDLADLLKALARGAARQSGAAPNG
jgi:hypothetical protein